MMEHDENLNAWRKGVSADEDCLSLEMLQGLVEGVPPGTPAAAHLAGCPRCQAELAMLRSFELPPSGANDQAAVEWITARLQHAEYVPSPAARIPWWGTWMTIPRLSGAVAATVMVGLALSLYVSNRQERPLFTPTSENENMRSTDIRLTVPSGDLDQAPGEFRWEASPLAKSYSIQLLEVDGTEYWNGQSAKNFLTTSRELKAKMHPGKTLLWKVTALDASGKPIASSGRGRFRVLATN
ncbi:MAG TPA: hypothetical protein VNW97_23915 [Candidatus Saccharimonadales bacterium]|jgi:hypothetical protein|nr:hypothetical protein [Candidatus Saccharimonadales bacterium]